MSINVKRKQQAKTIRGMRKIHRVSGISLFVFFFVVGLTGIILGWKKNSNGYILPKSMKGTSKDLAEWRPIDELHKKACQILHDSISSELSTKTGRIDIRDRKGIVKFVFKDHFYEIQLDGATGDLLQIAERRSDWIENIHDGTIVDDFIGANGYFKLFYTSILGLALIIFTISGFWLWYGPRRMRRLD